MRIKSLLLPALACLVCLSATAHAQDAPAAPKSEPTTGKTNEIAGMKFGVGLSFTWDVVDRERVDEAIIDANGIVRVTKKNNALARVMLESHYFFEVSGRKNVGWGPFVAVQPGSDEIINALGTGIMFGWKRSPDSDESFNIGFGYSVDPTTKVLGDEFVENEPAPKGPDGQPLPIRYQTRDQGGFLMLASFTWR